jgi:hypothetical protein
MMVIPDTRDFREQREAFIADVSFPGSNGKDFAAHTDRPESIRLGRSLISRK